MRKSLGRPNRKKATTQSIYSEGVPIKTEDEDPRFSNALARGLAILRAFSVDGALLGNLEIAEITGLPKSTVSRLTYTLTELGYLRLVEEHTKYELAAGVVGLAHPYLVSQPLPHIARPRMEALAAQTRLNIGLGVLEGFSVIYLEYAFGRADPQVLQRPGFRVPLARTAMGRACLGGMRSDLRARLIDDLAAYYKNGWPTLRRELQEAVEQVETRGYCMAIGALDPAGIAVGVPFVSADGRNIMAFNAQSLRHIHSEKKLMEAGESLVELAAEMRSQLRRVDVR
jgi:DNA-binding IclR family transcriptional regulator